MWKVNDDRVKRSAQSFRGPASLIPHESAECVCVCVCVTHIEGPESFLCARLLRSAHCGALRPSVRCISAVSWSYSSSHALPSVLWWKYAPSHRLLNARKTTQRFFTRIKKTTTNWWIPAKTRFRLIKLCSRSPKCYAQKRHKRFPHVIYSSCIFF